MKRESLRIWNIITNAFKSRRDGGGGDRRGLRCGLCHQLRERQEAQVSHPRSAEDPVIFA